MQIRWHNFGTYFGMKLHEHFCALRPTKQHEMCVKFSFSYFDPSLNAVLEILFSKFPFSVCLNALPTTVFDGWMT